MKRGVQRGPDFFDQLVHAKLEGGVSLEAILNELRQHPDVEYAHVNHVVRIDNTVPNDPDFSKLWGLHNTAQSGGTLDADIDAPEAWDLGTGNSQVIVAVIDTGIEYTHPDLAANMWVNPREIPGNRVDDDANGYIDDVYGYDFHNNDGDPKDDNFHGTHCSGTIGGVGHNGIGVAGVCWTVKLMALKFLSSSGGGYTSNAIKCIQYAVNQGAHIMSNSWGGSGFDQALQDAITAAHNAGVLFVAAAGNSNADASNVSPAGLQNVLTVSALDHNDGKATFSNFGPSIDVGAPGVNIWSTKLNGTYGYASGTSMACPHVAGLAALIKSRNVLLTHDQVENIIKTSADDRGSVGWDAVYGYGRINARRAMEMVAQNQVDFPTAIIASPKNSEVVGGLLNITGTAAGSNFAGYVLDYSGLNTPWTLITSTAAAVSNGTLGTVDVSSLRDGAHSIRLTVSDTLGRKIFATVIVQVDNIVAKLSLPSTVATRGGTTVNIAGSAKAMAGSLIRFTLEYGKGFSPSTWLTDRMTLSGGGTLAVDNGSLGAFSAAGLDGLYTIRLTVYTSLGSDSVSKTVNLDPYLRPGWPAILPQWSAWAPGLADVDGKNGLEVVVANSGGGLRVHGMDGTFLYAHKIQSGSSTTPIEATGIPAFGELSDVAGSEFAFLDNYWERLYACGQSSVLSGFPIRSAQDLTWNPRTAGVMARDIDGDGRQDLLAPTGYASWNGVDHKVTLHVVSRSGTAITGFPFSAPYTNPFVTRAGAVGDLDGDGRPEIFFSVVQLRDNLAYNRGTVKATLYGLDHQGRMLPGFPKDFTGIPGGFEVALGDLVIADLDGDSRKELIFCETARYNDGPFRWAIHAMRKDGTELAGWPYVREGTLHEVGGHEPQEGGMLVVGDVTGDASPEIVMLPTAAAMGGWWSYLTAPNAYVFRRDGTIAYTIGVEYKNEDGHSSYSKPYSLSLADITGDGKAEIFMTRYIVVGPSTTGSWKPSILVYSGASPILRLLPDTVTSPSDGPIAPSFRTLLAPEISDIDRDGTMDVALLALGSISGTLPSRSLVYVWSLPFAAGTDALEWPTAQGNIGRTGEYIPKALRNVAPPPPPADTQAPTCSITSPASGTTYTTAQTVTISASASDNIDVTKVEFYDNGALRGTDTASPFTFTWSITSATNGSHSWTAKAFDAAGNSKVSTAVSLTVNIAAADTTGPTLAITSPASGAIVSGKVTITATATDASGVARVEFYVNGTLLSTDYTSSWSVLWNSRPKKGQTATLTVKAYDTKGNLTTKSISVRVQ